MGKHAPDPGPQYMGAMLAAQQMAQQNQVAQQQLQQTGQLADQQIAAANRQNDLAQQQFQWAQDAYNKQQPTVQAINDAQLAGMTQQQQYAAADRARYENTYLPLQDQFIKTAQGWDTPEREQQQAGAAEAQVAQQTEQARQAAATALESYGVDPSSTRYAALDIGTRTGQAAAQAAAGNNAINQTQQQGLALQQQAIGMGNGLPSQWSNEFSGGINAGNSAVGNLNSSTQTGASTMGTGTQWGGLGNSALGSAAGTYGIQNGAYSGANQVLGGLNSTLGNIYQNQVAANNQSSGFGALAGMLGGSLMSAPMTGGGSFAGNLMQRFAEGGAVPDDDQTPGGAVPIAASPSGGKAVDDVPARLTPGEFVVPKDVVAWKGEEHFQKLIQKSRDDRQENSPAQPEVKQALPTGSTGAAGGISSIRPDPLPWMQRGQTTALPLSPRPPGYNFAPGGNSPNVPLYQRATPPQWILDAYRQMGTPT